MVKLFYLAVFYKQESNSVTCLKSAQDLTSFGYFQRGSIAEFMRFTSKVLIERSEIATRSSVTEQDYVCHCYIRADRLCGVLISDKDYPHRVAHTLLSKILDEFAAEVPQTQWPTLRELSANYIKLDQYLARFQNPKEADSMTKLQNDLDETKIILTSTIKSILERGEKLDNLVSKSEELSLQSKMFYKSGRKMNQCCQYY